MEYWAVKEYLKGYFMYNHGRNLKTQWMIINQDLPERTETDPQ